MKIAIIVPGGVDRSGVDHVIPCFLWLIERLARQHDTHVFALRHYEQPDTWDLLGARVHSIGKAPGWRRRLFTTFAREHRRTPFDVVHAFFGHCGAYASLLGWRHTIPVLFHAAGGELVALRDIRYGMRVNARGRAVMRLATAGATRVTVATTYMQTLANKHRIVAQRVPLGVALDRWPQSAPRRRDLTCPARLLHVGDLRPVKDQQTLLSAAEQLRERGVDYELDIAGCDTMDGALQRSPAARRLGSSLRWHGLLRRDSLRALMETADVLLVTSRHEAGPLVVLEAAVAGVPTIGTAVGHVVDWTPDAAVAVPIGDAVALAERTAAILDDEPRRLAIAHEAQRRALAIDADHTARAFEQIYLAMRH